MRQAAPGRTADHHDDHDRAAGLPVRRDGSPLPPRRPPSAHRRPGHLDSPASPTPRRSQLRGPLQLLAARPATVALAGRGRRHRRAGAVLVYQLSFAGVERMREHRRAQRRRVRPLPTLSQPEPELEGLGAVLTPEEARIAGSAGVGRAGRPARPTPRLRRRGHPPGRARSSPGTAALAAGPRPRRRPQRRPSAGGGVPPGPAGTPSVGAGRRSRPGAGRGAVRAASRSWRHGRRRADPAAADRRRTSRRPSLGSVAAVRQRPVVDGGEPTAAAAASLACREPVNGEADGRPSAVDAARRPGAAVRRAAGAVRLLVIETAGVLFSASDPVQELLVPHVRARGSTLSPAEVNESYVSRVVGGLPPAEFWAGLGILGDPMLLDDSYAAALRAVARHRRVPPPGDRPGHGRRHRGRGGAGVGRGVPPALRASTS